MAEDMEAVGVRPVPRTRHRAQATGRAAAVSRALNANGIRTRTERDHVMEGVWVFAYLPHSARVEIIVRKANVREAVITRVREVLTEAGYRVTRAAYTGKVVLYAGIDPPEDHDARK